MGVLWSFLSIQKRCGEVMRNLFNLSFVVAAAVALLSSNTADAGFQLKFTNGANTLIVNDGGINDSNANSGGIELGGTPFTFAGFSIKVTAGSSKPSVGSAANPTMDLQYTVTRGAGVGSLTIELTDTGFTWTPNSMNLSVGGTNLTSSQLFSAGASSSNTMYDMSSASTSIGAFSGSSFSGDKDFGYAGASPYALTLKTILTFTNSTSKAFGSMTLTSAVPEPASMAVWGLGALGLVVARKRRQTKLSA